MKAQLAELAEILEGRGKAYVSFPAISRLSSTLREEWELAHNSNSNSNSAESEALYHIGSDAAAMILHKLSRLAVAGVGHRDSWMDIAGYALRMAETLDFGSYIPSEVESDEWLEEWKERQEEKWWEEVIDGKAEEE